MSNKDKLDGRAGEIADNLYLLFGKDPSISTADVQGALIKAQQVKLELDRRLKINLSKQPEITRRLKEFNIDPTTAKIIKP